MKAEGCGEDQGITLKAFLLKPQLSSSSLTCYCWARRKHPLSSGPKHEN
ncbi:unnamed protein product [Rhodiola kirilowii]